MSNTWRGKAHETSVSTPIEEEYLHLTSPLSHRTDYEHDTLNSNRPKGFEKRSVIKQITRVQEITRNQQKDMTCASTSILDHRHVNYSETPPDKSDTDASETLMYYDNFGRSSDPERESVCPGDVEKFLPLSSSQSRGADHSEDKNKNLKTLVAAADSLGFKVEDNQSTKTKNQSLSSQMGKIRIKYVKLPQFHTGNRPSNHDGEDSISNTRRKQGRQRRKGVSYRKQLAVSLTRYPQYPCSRKRKYDPKKTVYTPEMMFPFSKPNSKEKRYGNVGKEVTLTKVSR